MIEKKTLLILGAGASEPLGFPVASVLVDEIVRGIRSRNFVNERLTKVMGRSQDAVDAFCDALVPRPYSIDRFLEDRNDLAEIGKEAIAIVLATRELGGNIDNTEGSRTWMHLLFDAMAAPKAEWAKSKLSVITFNYDRSFEFFLLTALRKRFKLSEAEAAEMLRSTVKPLIHVYGKLGGLPSLDDSEAPHLRYYGDCATSSDLGVASRGIHIVSDRNEKDSVFDDAKLLVREAEEIVCIGFGWDEMNMRRIGLSTGATGVIFGTTYRMSPAEVRKIENRLGPRVNQFGGQNQDAYRFLRSAGCLGLPVVNADDSIARRLVDWE
jgi:hypothetical protein